MLLCIHELYYYIVLPYVRLENVVYVFRLPSNLFILSLHVVVPCRLYCVRTCRTGAPGGCVGTNLLACCKL